MLYDQIRPEERLLIDASRKKFLTLGLHNSEGLYLNAHEIDHKEPFEDVVLQRSISYFRSIHLTALLESRGIRVINSSKSASLCGNKLLSTLELSKAGIQTPRTAVAFSIESALRALSDIGYPAVLKPIIGSWGRLVAPVNDRATAETILEHREQMNSSLLQIHYIQEMVNRPPRDIRTIVVGDRVAVSIYRSAPAGVWRTNVALGATTTPCPITGELEDVAIRAAKAVGGGVLAVDSMESPDGIVVLEVNSTIEFIGAAAATGVDIAKNIIEYLVEISKR
jgi:[lysine-biosynthesis-protein LysW]--L-2-aminoadipate ligase